MMIGSAILEMFYRANGQYVAPEQLRRAAGASAAEISAELADLQRLGYEFETHPHFGIRLLSAPDRLTADDIKARLNGQVIGNEILVFEETGSTNDVVAHLAAAGAREGLVVFAESQTKGRGRHGRSWISPRGKGLWFSVLLRPRLTAAELPRLTVAASVAVARALREATGVAARIKWPNDVTIDDSKVAGILTELHHGAAVLGIGIDVNCQADDLPVAATGRAISLAMATGQLQDRVRLAAMILAGLDEYYHRSMTGFDVIVAEWARWSTTLGRQVVLRMGARRLEGCAAALDDQGALLLRHDNGQIERILGADVVVEQS